MKLVVEEMELADIPQVQEVDRDSYTLPWPASAYRREVLHNRNARYFVLRELGDSSAAPPESEYRPRLPIPLFRWTQRTEQKPGRPGHIIGYAGMWMMVDEAHITTIAVRSTHRGRGLGELLLASLIDVAHDVGAQRVTLEVRVSNEVAQALYRKYGFHQEGRRPRYYSDNNEDAYIMTTGEIVTGEYQNGFGRLVDDLRLRLERSENGTVEAPVFPLPESASAGRDAE